MLEVGLTGGIATGKTVVRRRFESRGVPTLDADAVVHRLLGSGTDVAREVETRFGRSVIAEDGSVNRKALGALVFDEAAARKDLEAIVHPRVFEAISDFFGASREQGAEVAVVDAALMYETGSYRKYDRIIVAYCPRALQTERLMERDGLSREEAERRIGAQIPVEEKRDRADYVIDTSGSLEETRARADSVLEQLLKESEEKKRKDAKAQR